MSFLHKLLNHLRPSANHGKGLSGTCCPAEHRPSPEILKLAAELEGINPVQTKQLLMFLISGLNNATEADCYQTAEALVAAVYPKYKFSEYGRIFLEDEKFLHYYKQFMDANNWHSLDRKYTLNQLLKLTLHLEGDIAECGTYKGASAYLMCQTYQDAPDVVIHLFDSFEGLSTPNHHDGDYWVEGALTTSQEDLETTLAPFDNYRIYKGWIPTRFNEITSLNFRFLHIDVDLYQPTIESLNFFYERIVPRGIILMDDYGFKTCPGAKQAADDFFFNKPEQIIKLPTGQAFTVKQ